MDLVATALRRPITVVILIVGVLLAAGMAVVRMPRDILPSIGIPTLYLAEDYEGMTPEMMEAFITYYFEYMALYVENIKAIEDKNVQGEMVMKLTFNEGTDIAAVLAEMSAFATRALAFMPPGIFPPFLVHLDAGSLPVGYVVVSYKDKGRQRGELSLDELSHLQDEAMNRVRPYFATLPGLSSPAPFGASEPTVVLFADPQKLQKHFLSPLDVAKAMNTGEVVLPPGNIYSGPNYPMVSANYYAKSFQDIMAVPLRLATVPTITLGDVSKIKFVSNIQRGYAEYNGRRCAYLPVVKVGNASTLDVVNGVKASLPTFRELVPKNMNVDYVFDQSVYVVEAIKSLFTEGLLEAFLVGLVVFLFLRDFKSVFLVCSNIPLALMGGLLLLWLASQTVNIMTLGGLALSIAILVDQGIVTIENIFSHLGRGKSIAKASLDGATETVTPNLLATACIMAVFLPALFMKEVARALFVPLSLSVGFALLCSFVLSSSFVPISAIWIQIKAHEAHADGPFERFRRTYTKLLSGLIRARVLVVASYLAAASLAALWVFTHIGRDIFPPAEMSQFRMHLSAPAGSSIETTEAMTNQVLADVNKIAGPGAHTIGYVGMQSPDYAANLIYQFTSGPEESIVNVDLDKKKKWDIPAIKEHLRELIAKDVPQMSVSFEPSDLVSQILAQGSPTPVELAVTGTDFKADRAYADKFLAALKALPGFRDVRYEEPLDYPAAKIHIDRYKAGTLGFTVDKIADSVENYTMSSRYNHRTFWADLAHGVGYMVQTQIDQHLTDSLAKLRNMLIPLHHGDLYGGAVPLKDFATVSTGTIVGEYDRLNGEREIMISANLHNLDLGHASRMVAKVIKGLAKERPRGVWVQLRGEAPALGSLFSGLQTGLAMAVVVILILLSAYFQSPALAATVLSTTPAVLLGCGGILMLTGDTLNIQSYIGIIMCLGVAGANAIMLCVFAEHARLRGKAAAEAAIEGASQRLRPILMTALAMLAGMLPMALGLSESGKQSAPLGRAVFGGLLMATAATLLILPCFYAILRRKASIKTPSVHPHDPAGNYYEPERAASPPTETFPA